jgi:hypothetical protein
MTPSGIEPAPFRFVCLNQLRHRGRQSQDVVVLYGEERNEQKMKNCRIVGAGASYEIFNTPAPKGKQVKYIAC